MEDRMYTQYGCPCGDAWCHGCDDPQIEADIYFSRDARRYEEDER